MPSISTSSKLYRDFKDIDGSAYHTIVRFYESKSLQIGQLKFETYFDILVDYTNALFETGAYTKHLKEVDLIISLSIKHNIQFYKGQDIYFKSLFQKAAAHYNLLEYKQAEYILRELIKIAPYNSLPIRFLKKCKNQSRPTYIKTGRAISIGLFFIAALIAAIEVMFINPFVPESLSFFEYLWISILGIGIFILIATSLYHKYKMNMEVETLVKRARAKK